MRICRPACSRTLLGTILLLGVFALGHGTAAVAQDDESSAGRPPKPEVAARIDKLLADFQTLKEDIARLDERIAASTDWPKEILTARRDATWTTMFTTMLTLAREVAAQQDAGFDISPYMDSVLVALRTAPDEAHDAIDHIRARVVFPERGLEPAKLVIADQELLRSVTNLDNVFRALGDYIKLAKKFGLDASEETDYLTRNLLESAANRSAFLDRALSDAATLRAATATLPNNAELTARRNAIDSRVARIAHSLQDVVAIMAELGLETRTYRQQILTATGEITTDVLDVGVVTNLFTDWLHSLTTMLKADGPKFIFRVVLVGLIILLFWHLGNLVRKAIDKGLDRSPAGTSRLMRNMILSATRNLFILLGILIALSQIGVSLGPMLAGLGIAGFIVGFALQDSLANFASGMLILFYRPYDVGDVIDTSGKLGKVSHMTLVNTTLLTFDNQKVVLPNNMIWGSVITNLTAQHTRRVDLVFGISYASDIEKALIILREIVEQTDAVLKNPEPLIRVHSLGDSSVNLMCRPWVKTEDYWETYWGLLKAVKLRFDAEGIKIPFPQRDIHLFEHRPPE